MYLIGYINALISSLYLLICWHFGNCCCLLPRNNLCLPLDVATANSLNKVHLLYNFHFQRSSAQQRRRREVDELRGGVLPTCSYLWTCLPWRHLVMNRNCSEEGSRSCWNVSKSVGKSLNLMNYRLIFLVAAASERHPSSLMLEPWQWNCHRRIYR